MLYYLINATLIWLICLLLFDLLLKKETYHAYNRAYLGLSFISGLLLPLIEWKGPVDNVATVVDQTIIRSAEMKQNVVYNITPTTNGTRDWASILLFIYAAGCIVSLFFIIRELIQLYRLYKQGTVSKNEGYTLVETGRAHSPFSFFGLVFVSAVCDYDTEQWPVVLKHELQHAHRFHVIDKILMHIFRILFWFHPLVHIYYRRMMIVHEYEADSVVTEDATVYGCFLIEQSILQRSPSLTHSFAYSPLKNRIQMLTRKKSSGLKLAKYFVALPVVVVLSFICSTVSYSHDKVKKGNKIYFKGNEFELKGFPAGDTIEMMDPATNKKQTVVMTRDSSIEMVNGKKIYEDDNIKQPMLKGPVSFEEFVFERLRPELEKLNDADNYVIRTSDLIVDENGKLVYYEIEGITQAFKSIPTNKDKVVIEKDVAKNIKERLTAIFDSGLDFEPSKVDGKPVAGIKYFRIDLTKWVIVVKDHKATLKRLPYYTRD